MLCPRKAICRQDQCFSYTFLNGGSRPQLAGSDECD